MYKDCDVVMLATKEKANMALIGVNNEVKLFQHSKAEYELSETIKPQHLYILSDEEIKEGDWFFNSIDNSIKQATNWIYVSTCKKIIGATDSSLDITGNRLLVTNDPCNLMCRLPQIPQLFIEYFIIEYNKGNIITKVKVEYESYCVYGNNCPSKGAYDKQHLCKINYKLKINPDNIINIKPIKDSWSKDEVIKLIEEVRWQSIGNPTEFTKNFDKWIEENL